MSTPQADGEEGARGSRQDPDGDSGLGEDGRIAIVVVLGSGCAGCFAPDAAHDRGGLMVGAEPLNGPDRLVSRGNDSGKRDGKEASEQRENKRSIYSGTTAAWDPAATWRTRLWRVTSLIPSRT